MLKVLLPVDGSGYSQRAVADFVKLLDWYKEKPEFHLLSVQYPLDGNVSLFINQADIKQYNIILGLTLFIIFLKAMLS